MLVNIGSMCVGRDNLPGVCSEDIFNRLNFNRVELELLEYETLVKFELNNTRHVGLASLIKLDSYPFISIYHLFINTI